MGLEFINRIIRTSLIVSALTFLFVAVYRSFAFGLGIFLGTAWGCVNLFFITETVKEAFSLKKPNKGKVLLILLVKFPLLYTAGYFLLRLKYFRAESLLIGFTLIFLITFLKALGQVVLPSFSSEERKVLPLNPNETTPVDKNLR